MLSLASVGSVLLAEGFKFLYQQAGLLIKRWTERAQARTSPDLPLELPAALGGGSLSGSIKDEILSKVIEPLREVRRDLNEHFEGLSPIDSSDEQTVENINMLRRLVETVYQQKLTFANEQRESSEGPSITASLDVGAVLGYVSQVRAKRLTAGRVEADARIGTVGAGGTVVQVDIDEIG
jgi:hypothetical protein